MYPNLYVEMAAHNRMTQRELAKLTQMHEKTLGDKLRGRSDFCIGEMRRIQAVFNKPLDYLFATNA